MLRTSITCPNCSTEISIDEVVAAPLLMLERERITAEETAKARSASAAECKRMLAEVATLKADLALRDEKLAEAQKAQADTMRARRALDDAIREFDLTVERRVQASLDEVRDRARTEAENGLKLLMREKNELIASMRSQIDELKRRAEQGSERLRGEMQEIELESILRLNFPSDQVLPVPRGQHGGDILQRIVGPGRQLCGCMLWESKRTRSWSDGWLAKLRNDQRAAGAEFALLVTHALPRPVSTFGLVEGVWVTNIDCAIPLAIALRQSLIGMSRAHRTTGMEGIYEYLTGPRFLHRVEAIVEHFCAMREDLDRERKTAARLWAKRDTELRGILEATAGMCGDLQGIAGRPLLFSDRLGILELDADLEKAAS